jgi:GT2 family glycosyltransferase
MVRGIITKRIISIFLWYFKGIIWLLVSIIRRNRGLYLFVRGLRYSKKHGIRATIIKVNNYLKRLYIKRLSLLERELDILHKERIHQENTRFPNQIKVSIITPLYNTPEEHLDEMIQSVLVQTYGNWELCLVDGSDAEYTNIRYLCEYYAQLDQRVKYQKLEKNLGISNNSNKALETSTGEYIAILEHDDVLHPSALYEIMEVICQRKADFIYTDEAFFSSDGKVIVKHYKPHFAVDTLCSHNYISRFIAFSRTLTEKAGLFRSEFDGSQDYDLILRYTAVANKIYHISKILYFHRRREKSNIGKKVGVMSAAENAIADYLKKRGYSAQVEAKIGLPGFYRINYNLLERPVVSIIIPNRNNTSLLRRCLSSIREKSTYTNYEIIIVENNSNDNSTFNFYKELDRYHNFHIVTWEGKNFNFSEICNLGVMHAKGQHLLFLNNDIEIITPNWIEEMLMYSQRADVGAVGNKLYFSNGSIQHAGVALGIEGTAGHIYYGAPFGSTGYMGKLQIVQNISAVTAACMMVRRKVFEEIGLFEPEFYASYNDIDLCIKIRKAGYLIVWTPYAEAYHLESRSRGYNLTKTRKRRLVQEMTLFKTRWKEELSKGDPYYNCNFSLENANYTINK